MISIHAPLAGRDISVLAFSYSYSNISIHAPLAGRDEAPMPEPSDAYLISIHAPLAGRDGTRETARPREQYFNPRAPRGARPYAANVSPD